MLVADIEPSLPSSAPDRLVAYDGRAWFRASTADRGGELWVSDGSPAGTRLAVEFVAGIDSGFAEPLVALNANQLLVAARDTIGDAIYVVTPVGVATRLASARYCALAGLPQRTTVAGSLVFFPASTGNGCEPFVSDGTVTGTFALGDLVSGSGNSNPQRFVAVGAQVFFTATTPATGRELWVSDGTAVGTRPVADFATGTTSADPTGLIEQNGRLLFIARDAATARRLRSTDANVIDNIEPMAGFTTGNETVRFGTEVCFAGNDGSSGNELWCSDGSGGGTRRVRDLFAGIGSSSPAGFLAANTALGARLFYISTNSADSIFLLRSADRRWPAIVMPQAMWSYGAATAARSGPAGSPTSAAHRAAA